MNPQRPSEYLTYLKPGASDSRIPKSTIRSREKALLKRQNDNNDEAAAFPLRRKPRLLLNYNQETNMITEGLSTQNYGQEESGGAAINLEDGSMYDSAQNRSDASDEEDLGGYDIDGQHPPSEDPSNDSDSDLDNDADAEAFGMDPLVHAENSEKIHPSLSLTKGELLALLFAFYIRHSPTKVLMGSILAILNLVVPGCAPRSLYLFEKMFSETNKKADVQFKCPECQSYLGKQGDRDYTCKYCNLTYDGTQLYKSNHFFLTYSIKDQLKSMLESTSLWKLISKTKSNSSFNPDVRGEIYTGRMYQAPWLKTFLGDMFNFTCSFSTDGIRLFKSAPTEIWPIFVTINEIDFQNKSKHLMLCSLWYGSGKPKMETLFRPFVEEIQKLFKDGFNWIDSGQERLSKVAFALGIFDAPARAAISNMNQFNGRFGCGYCLDEGKRVEKGAGYMRCFPLMDPASSRRDHSSTIKYAEEVVKQKQIKHVMGVKGPSMLCLLPKYDIINGMIPDYMHAVLLGVVNQFLTIWLNSVGSEYYIQNCKLIDELLSMIRPPLEIRRTPRSLGKHFADYKASELRNWLLFYSPVILRDLLPPKYYKHWMLLVTSFRILLKKQITVQQIDKVKMLINKFIEGVEELYGEEHCTYNVHILAHIVEFADLWGAPWAYSSFLTEDAGGFLKKLFYGSTHAAEQIFSRFLARSYCRKFARLYIPYSSDSVRELYERLDSPLSSSNHGDSSTRNHHVQFCGSKKLIKMTASQIIAIENSYASWFSDGPASCHFAWSGQRVQVKGKMYSTADYCAGYQRDNSVVCYGTNSEKVGKIIAILNVSLNCKCNRDCNSECMVKIGHPISEYVIIVQNIGLESVPPIVDADSKMNLTACLKKVSPDYSTGIEAISPNNITHKCVLITDGHSEKYCIKVDVRFEKD